MCGNESSGVSLSVFSLSVSELQWSPELSTAEFCLLFLPSCAIPLGDIRPPSCIKLSFSLNKSVLWLVASLSLRSDPADKFLFCLPSRPEVFLELLWLTLPDPFDPVDIRLLLSVNAANPWEECELSMNKLLCIEGPSPVFRIGDVSEKLEELMLPFGRMKSWSVLWSWCGFSSSIFVNVHQTGLEIGDSKAWISPIEFLEQVNSRQHAQWI